MANKNWLSMLAFFASFVALGVIALGAFTRLIDAGLGCPDWPGCYGHLIVPVVSENTNTALVIYKAWAEMVHRYFAGCLGILMLSIFVLTWQKKYRTKSNLLLSAVLLILLGYQILLGMLTVTLKLLPVIVTQHLLGGFLILSALWLIYLNNTLSSDTVRLSRVKKNGLLLAAALALLLLFVQIILGAWTSTNYAALSCADFPFCSNNQPIMTLYIKQAFALFSPVGVNYEGGVLSMAVRQTIQMMHRFGALIVTVYLLVFTFFAMPIFKNAPTLTRSLYFILGGLAIQLCLGISNVLFKLPIVIAISHTLVAALLLLSLITFVYQLAKVSIE